MRVAVHAALAAVPGDGAFHVVSADVEADLLEGLGVVVVFLHHLGRDVGVARGVAAIEARLALGHLLADAFELGGVGGEADRRVGLLLEEHLAVGVVHARRFGGANQRVGIDVHAVPGFGVREVAGVPPLDFQVAHLGMGAGGQRDAVGRLLAGAGGTRRQAVGMAGGQHHRLGGDGVALAGRVVDGDNADDLAFRPGQERRHRSLFQGADVPLGELLAPAVHQEHAGLPLLVGGDVAHPPDAGHDVALVVAAEVEAGLVELGVEGLFDPASPLDQVVLVDEEVVPPLCEVLHGVLGLGVGGAQHVAAEHQVAGEDGAAALADQPLADDQWIVAEFVQAQRRVGAGAAAADDDHVLGHDFHDPPPPCNTVADSVQSAGGECKLRGLGSHVLLGHRPPTSRREM